MLKVELADLFRIEKVIRRDSKRGRALVKWSGYRKTHLRKKDSRKILHVHFKLGKFENI